MPGWFLAELLVHQSQILGIITIFQVNLECIFTQKTGEVKRIWIYRVPEHKPKCL